MNKWIHKSHDSNINDNTQTINSSLNMSYKDQSEESKERNELQEEENELTEEENEDHEEESALMGIESGNFQKKRRIEGDMKEDDEIKFSSSIGKQEGGNEELDERKW